MEKTQNIMHGARGGGCHYLHPPTLFLEGTWYPPRLSFIGTCPNSQRSSGAGEFRFAAQWISLGGSPTSSRGIFLRLWNEEASADRLCSSGLLKVWGCFGGMSACHPLHGGAKAAGPEQGVILVIPRLLVTLRLLPPFVIISHDPKRNLSGLSSVVLPKGSERK